MKDRRQRGWEELATCSMWMNVHLTPFYQCWQTYDLPQEHIRLLRFRINTTSFANCQTLTTTCVSCPRPNGSAELAPISPKSPVVLRCPSAHILQRTHDSGGVFLSFPIICRTARGTRSREEGTSIPSTICGPSVPLNTRAPLRYSWVGRKEILSELDQLP